jgi:YD repeat-containing protein
MYAMKYFRRVIAVAISAVSFGVPATAQTPFFHQGIDPLHPPDSALPNEQVDPASGTLTVVATDVVLPGNAGFNLAVTRVYNSSVYPDYDSGSTELEEDSWVGMGWKLHFGRILHADSQSAGQMQIEMGDGSRHALYHSFDNPNIWTTADFWRYNPATHVLQLPNGRVYTFNRDVTLNTRLGDVRYVTEIRDPFNNTLTFTYFDAPGPIDGVASIHQTLSASESRDVTFGYDPTLNALTTMTYDTHQPYGLHVWHYDQVASGPAGFSVLTGVHPPQGPATAYDYSGAELTAIHAPFGGTIAYTYADAVRVAGTLSTRTRVVTTRTMSGHDVPTGTWTFAYSTGANSDTTLVACPCGGTTAYRFNGTGASGSFFGWNAGSIASVTVTDGNRTLETRTYTWVRSEPISPDPVSGQNGTWSDDAVYKPLMSSVATTRDGSTWTTTQTYHTGQGTFNDYGQPYDTYEAGETIYQWRHTTRTFQTGFAPYILGAVASQTVSENSAYGQFDGTATSSTTYDLSTGFVTSQTAGGVTTIFAPTASGNLASTTDANSHTTTFDYDWGVQSGTHAGGLSAASVITPEGLVESTTDAAGELTTFLYDAAFRPYSVTPPHANPTTYAYDDLHGSWITVTRDQSIVTHLVDAFGREVSSYNSQNLHVGVMRDTCGRVTNTSDPYTTAPSTPGTITAYDALGRVISTTDSAGKTTTISYNGIGVGRTDANNHQTTFESLAFGDPANSRLWRVTDATGTATTYRYDITGALTHVSGPLAGVERSWAINAMGRPDSDTQPESGTTSYLYDAVGNRTRVTDATGAVTTFAYDALNRLTDRNTAGAADYLHLQYSPTTGRIVSMTTNEMVSTFTYDDANRRVTRSDAVTNVGTFATTSAGDANGNLSTLTYPSGRVVTYHYDGENRLTSLDQQPNGAPEASVFANGFTYGDDGRLSSYVTGAVTHHFTYEANRPKHLWTTGGTDALDLFYSYDNVGNVLSIADPRPGANQSFTMDALDRLTIAYGPWGSLAWTYDAAGNRLTEQNAAGVVTYDYTAATQRLDSLTWPSSGTLAETFQYDNAGRVTRDKNIDTYAYSPVGHLQSASRGTAVVASYKFDTSDERFASTVNGQTTYSIRLGAQTLSEYTSSCAAPIWTRDLIYADGQLLGAVKAVLTQPTVAMLATTATASENTGTASVLVKLTTPNGATLACGVSVPFATSSGTAIADADFADTTGLVSFPAGAANGSTASITVPLIRRAGHQGTRTFTVGLASAAGVTVGTPSSTTVTIVDVTTRGDFDGDRKTDLTVWRATNGDYYWLTSSSSYDYTSGQGVQFGNQGLGDVPMVGDVDGDGRADLIVWRASTGVWYWNLSSTSYTSGGNLALGTSGDQPLLGDFDGDGKVDFAVWHPATGTYSWTTSSSNYGSLGTQQWGSNALNDKAMLADIDGDGKSDFVVWRPGTGTWYYLLSSTNYVYGDSRVFGDQSQGDQPLLGDFDGDGRADLAVWRTNGGLWRWVTSSSGYDTSQVTEHQWGSSAYGDVPVIADIDGDGKADLVVWRATNGTWYWETSSSGFNPAVAGSKQWGSSSYGDIPLPGGGGQ